MAPAMMPPLIGSPAGDLTKWSIASWLAMAWLQLQRRSGDAIAFLDAGCSAVDARQHMRGIAGDDDVDDGGAVGR